MSKTQSPKRDKAKGLLVWYFCHAVTNARNDRDFSSSAQEEMQAIVDLIVDAAVEEIKTQYERRVSCQSG